MKFFEWWGGLPWQLRIGVALLILVLSAIHWWIFQTFWPWGWAAGIVMLLFSFPSSSEWKGYHD
jgi:hypothetical protein